MHTGRINYNGCINFSHLGFFVQRACTLPGGGFADAHSYSLVIFDDDFVDMSVNKTFTTVLVYNLRIK